MTVTPDRRAAESPARIATIDGLRGLAVMGILLMNITGFALPAGAYFNPHALGQPSTADLAIWAIDFILIDGKMRALFSILFGASMLIIARRTEAAGGNIFLRHAARMAVLALFGALHLYLIWPGDILLHYAMIGMLALPFTEIEPRQQIRIALMLLVVQLLVGAGFLASFLSLRAAALAPHPDAASIQSWWTFAEGVGVGRPADILQEISVYRGPWTGIVVHTLTQDAATPLFLLLFNGPETLAFMLIGMAGLETGFLSGAWPRRDYTRAAIAGFAIGLPMSAALCWLCFHSRFDTITTFSASTLGGVLLRPLLALASAALAMRWLTVADGSLRARIAAAGRTAFTNYLGTSLVMTALFYGWGFGLYARIDRVWLYPIVPIAWIAMLAWSKPWLAHFRYGPFEWAWRSLARGKLQAIR